MTTRLSVEHIEDRITPAVGLDPTAFVVAGADAGAPPEVRFLDPTSNRVVGQFLAYDGRFIGGVRVATGDVNGDGTPDIVTAPGPSGGPDVRVYDGTNGQLIRNVMAYEPNFTGGVFVAVADLDGDGAAEVITGAGARGGAQVAVFDGATGDEVDRFFAYDPNFNGGVRVSAGDLDGDGTAEIITAAGPGGGPHVQVFDFDPGLNRYQPTSAFFAYDPSFNNGVFVSAGDVNGDGTDEIVTGTSFGGGSHVRTFGADGSQVAGTLGSFFAYEPTFTGGVRVSAADLDGDGLAEVVTTPGPGGSTAVKVFRDGEPETVTSQFAFPADFRVGTFVAAGTGVTAFPSTPDSLIAQAYADLQAAIEGQRRQPQPQQPVTVIIDQGPRFFGNGLGFGFSPFLFGGLANDPFFFDAPSFYYGFNNFYGPGFFPDPIFFSDPLLADPGIFGEFFYEDIYFPPELIFPQDPFFGDPFFGDPFFGDPFFGDPFFGDPFFGDPFFGDPFFGDPYFGDPFFSDPFFDFGFGGFGGFGF